MDTRNPPLKVHSSYEWIIMLKKCGCIDLTVFHLIWVIVVVPKPRIIAIVGVFYFRSYVFYITELWRINQQINKLAWKCMCWVWGDHRGVWGCWASGARVLPRSIETVPLGCGRLVVSLETVPFWDCLRGFDFGTTFSGFSTFLSCIFCTHVLCGQLTVSFRSGWFESFRSRLISSSQLPCDGAGGSIPNHQGSLLTFDSLFRSSSRSWHELRQWDMVIVLFLILGCNGVW